MRSIDRALDGILSNSGVVPLQIVNERRQWQGSTMTFSFDAKMGPISAPIKGLVDVTDKDLTVDVDLGLFERLLGNQARGSVEERVRALLK